MNHMAAKIVENVASTKGQHAQVVLGVDWFTRNVPFWDFLGENSPPATDAGGILFVGINLCSLDTMTCKNKVSKPDCLIQKSHLTIRIVAF